LFKLFLFIDKTFNISEDESLRKTSIVKEEDQKPSLTKNISLHSLEDPIDNLKFDDSKQRSSDSANSRSISQIASSSKNPFYEPQSKVSIGNNSIVNSIVKNGNNFVNNNLTGDDLNQICNNNNDNSGVESEFEQNPDLVLKALQTLREKYKDKFEPQDLRLFTKVIDFIEKNCDNDSG